jgi:hypothetical protein
MLPAGSLRVSLSSSFDSPKSGGQRGLKEGRDILQGRNLEVIHRPRHEVVEVGVILRASGCALGLRSCGSHADGSEVQTL